MKRNLLTIMSLLAVMASMAQPQFDKPHGLYDEAITMPVQRCTIPLMAVRQQQKAPAILPHSL